MSNPILDFVLDLAAEGLHPSAVSVESADGLWRCRVELDDWCPLGDGGDKEHVVSVDRTGLPDGVSIKARERFSPSTLPLELPERGSIAAWMADVAAAGHAPDVVRVTPIHYLTKPIEWLREPIRSALLRRAARPRTTTAGADQINRTCGRTVGITSTNTTIHGCTEHCDSEGTLRCPEVRE